MDPPPFLRHRLLVSLDHGLRQTDDVLAFVVLEELQRRTSVETRFRIHRRIENGVDDIVQGQGGSESKTREYRTTTEGRTENRRGTSKAQSAKQTTTIPMPSQRDRGKEGEVATHVFITSAWVIAVICAISSTLTSS